MYEIIKNVIESGRYELTDMLKKIDTCWIQNDITEEQKTELVALAQEKARPENSYAPLQEQIDKLATELATVKTQTQENTSDILAIKDKLKEESIAVPEPVPEPEPSEEYPEYVNPTGAHDAYYKDDKVTYNGKKYICIAPDGVACVWSPDVYPQYWQEVIE